MRAPWRLADRRWLVGGLLLALGCGGSRAEAPPSPTGFAEPGASSPGAPATTPVPDAEGPHHSDAPADQGPIHGELRTVQGQRILRVWGTPAQMGHAHGALLRTAILEIVDGYALDVIPPAMLDAAGELYAEVARVPPRLQQEAEGIVAGMEAAGGAHVERLGRSLRPADLLVLNAMTDLLAIGCSSVSAWGPSMQTGTPTEPEPEPALGGAPVMVRNLDWSDDPELLANQVIIAYHPEDPARQPVVSVAFAGYIGCLSCINEAGVAALFNMGYGAGAASPTRALKGFAPANLLLRDTLERRDVDHDGRSTADDLEAAWRAQTHAGSYILHVIEPRRADGPAPARVLEVEADGVVTRSAEPEGLGPSLLAATNHLRRKSEPTACDRYDQIERTVAERRGRFDREALWSLGTRLRLPAVVHALRVEPETRRLAVWLRGPGQSHGASDPPVEHTWAALMRPPAE